jgi:hypothetical protein
MNPPFNRPPLISRKGVRIPMGQELCKEINPKLPPPLPLKRSDAVVRGDRCDICAPPAFCNDKCEKPIIYILFSLFEFPHTESFEYSLVKYLEERLKDNSWKCTKVKEMKPKVQELLHFLHTADQQKTLEEAYQKFLTL